jgi:type VI secretion system protein ImpG
MLKDHYQRELANLRELGVEFSRDNPALAPMLAAKGDDPDVERLLEGVAFLSGLVRQELDEGFPDLLESLLRVVLPQALLPVPSATMMRFSPVQGFAETIRLPKGAMVASVPAGGAKAVFSTTEDLDIAPAAVTQADLREAGDGEAVLSLTVSSSAPLSTWLSDSLSIHLAGDYPQAVDRRLALLTRLSGLSAETRSKSVSLAPSMASRVGFGPSAAGFGRQPLSPFELTRDYFAMPQRFLTIRVGGLAPLAASPETRFILKFGLSGLDGPLPAMRPEHFLLNCCPAVNVFPHPAQPLAIDHRLDEYLLRPADFEAAALDIYAVAKVSSVLPGGAARIWDPFESFSPDRPDARIYSLARRISPATGRPEHHLSVVYPEGADLPSKETVSVDLLCHNVGVTERLRSGEISQPTDTSPAMATFSNIIPPTRHCPPVEGGRRLWNLLSHLHVNLMQALTTESLKEMLALHSLPGDPDPGRSLSNKRRVQAVSGAAIRLETSFVKGLPLRGSHVEVTVDPAGFASKGDLHLFGDALDHLFGLYHHINSYSRLTMVSSATREVFQWPPRLGLKRLL